MSSGEFGKKISPKSSADHSCEVQVSSDVGRVCFASIFLLIVVVSQETTPLPRMRAAARLIQ
jgi:hypothetical protein